MTVIKAISLAVQNGGSICLGRIDEVHYILTLPALPIPQENNNHTLNDVLDSARRSNDLVQNIFLKRKMKKTQEKKQNDI